MNNEKIMSLYRKFLNRETIMYLIVGVINTILSVAVYSACIYFGMNIAISNTVAYIISILFAFITNKTLVFESRSFALKTVVPEFIKFFLARFLMYITETPLLVILVDMIGLNSFICKIFTTAMVIVANYFLSKKAVFK